MSILALDIGGTFIKYGVWNQDELKETNKFETPKSWDGLVECIKAVLEKFQKNYLIEGIAISAPGAVNHKTGIIEVISAIPYLGEIEFKKELEAIFGLPVEIENDANCAALAENWLGHAKGFERVLFVVIGTGIGGAIINRGRIEHGVNLFGGEFGLMVLDRGKIFSELGTVSSMAKRFSKEKGKIYSGEDVFRLAEQNDSDAKAAVEEFYNYLSLGIYNLLVSYNPDRVVIGGGISERDGFIEEVNIKVKEKLALHNVPNIRCDIVPCRFRNSSNLIGAVSLLQKESVQA